ncbi:antitoxin Xre-like helix-turn-helix domain-containing protein [uncultured Cohaesibacter sp.]|uniref:antitoxin Xre-like helix-turn-helix domain-containing protein n=1 Tax=uncultured Cohaesibacter sp. TaxID=1002546 RepID=UPI0029C8A836|nr:antitoxin Xre-like helix-turn-helix domain-containing protein [uncultured Cohaesibacter sp.]
MEPALKTHPPADRQAVALKAYGRIARVWGLTQQEAAGLADMSESTWKRARKDGFAGSLTRDQMLRLSALVGIYKSLELYFNPPIATEWVKLANDGPEFDGARPVDVMISGGLPKILRVRTYLDALRGGM